MNHARDEAGNIWEVDAQGNPVRLVQPAAAGLSGNVGMTVAPNPMQVQQRELQLQAEKQRLANGQLQHDKLLRDAQQAQDGTGFVLPTSGVHGDAYLATLPSGIAQEVKAISDGRMPLSARVMSSPKMQGLLQHVVNYDPTFDAVNYNTRAKTRADFTSGKDAANITALNTALGHAGSLMEAAENLHNYGGWGTLLNPARNALSRARGEGRVDAYNVNKQAFASEMERVFRGTGGSLQGIQDWERSLSAANSPAQFQQVMGKAAELLKSRIDALNQQYRGGMGKTADITELLTPEAQEAYGKLYDGRGNVHVMFGGVNGQAGGGTPGVGGPQQPSFGGGSSVAPPSGPGDGVNSFSTNATGRMMAQQLSDAFNKGASVDDLDRLLQANGFDTFSSSPERLQEIQSALQTRQQGGRVQFTPPVQKPSVLHSITGNAADTPLGTFGVRAANAATGGVLDRLTGPLAADYLREQHPTAATLGDLAGNVAGVAMLGGVGGLATKGSRLGAWLAANPIKAGALTDSLYGGIYGNNEADPGNRTIGTLTGAAAGGAGSAIGSGLGRVAGKAISGVVDPTRRYLADRGVPMTLGQLTGGIPQRVENRIAGLPVVGDLLKNRYRDAFEKANRAAFNEAGDSIGAGVNATGSAGINKLRDAASGAYDNSTAGVTVPIDDIAVGGLTSAFQMGKSLPPDLRTRFATAISNRVRPAAGDGSLTGDAYQQAIRALKGYKAEAPKPGFEQDYRDALSGVQDALTGTMMRNGGAKTVEGLNNANRTWANLKVLQNAVSAAKNGSASGKGEIFTGAQLNNAAERSARRAGMQGTDSRPFYKIGNAMNDVLGDKIPDSGTAGRLVTAALPGLLTAGGAGYAASEGYISPTQALAIAALTVPATKPGAKLIQAAALKRTPAMAKIGQEVARRARLGGGIFGAPLLLENMTAR